MHNSKRSHRHVRLLAVLSIVIRAAYGYDGTVDLESITLISLIAAPLFWLVGIGLLFEMQQAAREERRAEAERNLGDQRAQDEALQTYLGLCDVGGTRPFRELVRSVGLPDPFDEESLAATIRDLEPMLLS